MNVQKSTLVLVAVLILTTILVAGLATYLMYRTALTEETQRLTETAQSQARLMESVARFAARQQGNSPSAVFDSTIAQVRDAHNSYEGFGETGEFTLAMRAGEQIVFLLSHRHFDTDSPKPVAFDDQLAEPMRRALQGQSGTLIGLDYRGEQVLAAHEPVAVLDLGIVAKIDMAEVRAPFIQTFLVLAGLSTLLAGIGALVVFRITAPWARTLQQSEETLRLAIGATSDGIWDWDIPSDEVFFSPTWLNILGLHQLHGHYDAWAERLHPEDRARVMESLQQHLQGETDFWQGEHRLKHANGDWIWVLGRGRVAARDAEGKPLRMLGTMTDISAGKQAEAKIRDAEAQIRLLLDSTAEGIYGVDIEGNCIFANQACLQALGYRSPQEVIGKPMHELAHHTHAEENPLPKNECPIDLALREGRPAHSTRELFWRKNGTSFPVEYWSHPIIQRGRPSGAVVTFIDITERNALEKQLRRMALHDSLTGLYNREAMEQRIREEITRSRRYQHSFSVFLLDIDHFKQVNDTHGHAAGDAVLQQFGNILSESTRENDYVARHGGEEFVLLLPETTPQQAHELAERLRCKIATTPIEIDDERQLCVTSSIGVATYPVHGSDYDSLISMADQAMYRAKHLGRDSVQTAQSA